MLESTSALQEKEFDEKGNETHEDLKKYEHEFVPSDWCAKCGELQHDSDGIETHPSKYLPNVESFADHDFVSGVDTEHHENREKRKEIATYVGVGLAGIAAIASVLSLFG